jgi:hypothetical protein
MENVDLVAATAKMLPKLSAHPAQSSLPAAHMRSQYKSHTVFGVVSQKMIALRF